MNKKNFFMAVGGGFIAGLGTALLVCSFCCAPKPQMMSNNMPLKLEMLQQHRHHHMKPGFHHKNFKHRQFSEEMKEHFAQKLGLTDEQKQQLDKFRDEDMAKMKPLMEQMKDLKKQIREVRKESRAHFESVLTDEQKATLKTMKKGWHHHKHHFAPKGEDDLAPKNPAMIKKDAGINADGNQ